jgi:hypothetical protein
MAQEEAPVRHIFRWDLDKTYLRTEFDSVRDLIRTALQKPEEKINVPGADGLLRELTRPDEAGRSVLTFISGSPEQMRRTLEQKFELDGVRPDAFILKPQLRLLLKGKFRAIRGQIGYKLDALLRVRGMTPLGPETLFGDDAEQDAFIYSLYGDLVGDRIDIDTLTEILQAANVYPDTRDLILERARTTPRQDTVTRIFINLDRRSAPGRFLPFGPRVIPITNYFQAALVLMRDSVLSPAGLVRMASGMVRTAGYGIPELANSFQDMGRRGLLGAEVVEMLEDARDGFEDLEDVPRDFPERLLSRLRALSPRSDLPERDWEGPPDYLEILEADREMREALEEKPSKRRSLNPFS